MAYRVWSPLEMFELLKYPNQSIEELSLRLNRTENAVRSKIQELNISSDYNKNSLKENSLRKFCSDCIYSPASCRMNPKDCLKSEDAKLYRKFYNIRLDDEQKHKKIAIPKKERVAQMRLL